MQKAETTKTTTVVQQKPEPASPFFAPVVGRGNAVTSGAPAVIQPKLQVNAPGDAHEREADAMADQVLRIHTGGPQHMPTQNTPARIQRKCATCAQEPEAEEMPVQRKITGKMSGAHTFMIQRKCASCEQEETLQRQELDEEETVQTKTLTSNGMGGGFTTSPLFSQQLQSRKGNGRPLAFDTRQTMDQAFGADFSSVRIHTDSQAAELSQGIQAKAFTHGSDIFFNRGTYNPGTSEGQWLLAHELTHVVQQGQHTSDSISRKISPLPGLFSAFKSTNLVIPQTTPPISLPETSATPAGPNQSAAIPVQSNLPPQPGTDETDTATAAPEITPLEPKDDPEFKRVEKKVLQNASTQKSPEEDITVKTENLKAAAQLPVGRRKRQAALEQLHTNAEATLPARFKTPLEEADQFVDDLKAKIRDKETTNSLEGAKGGSGLVPTGSGADAAEQMDREKYAGQIRETVPAENALGAKISSLQNADPTLYPEHADLTVEAPGDPRLIHSARKAAPKHRTEAEISLEAESQSLDQPFEEHNIPEGWVRDSENPEYQAAYNEKTEAQKALAEAPEKYKEIEIPKIEQSEQSFQKTVNTAKASMGGMHKQRQSDLSNIAKAQTDGAQHILKGHGDKIGKEEYLVGIERIYTKTSKKVNDCLQELPNLTQRFEKILEDANNYFKKRSKEMWGYLYPDFYVLDRDWPSSKNKTRERLQKQFLEEELHKAGNDLFDQMKARDRAKRRSADLIFNNLKNHFDFRVFEGRGEAEFDSDRPYLGIDHARILAFQIIQVLNKARTAIKEGQKELADLKSRLIEDGPEIANAEAAMNARFQSLAESVEEQKGAIIDEMKNAYKQTAGGLKESYEKIGSEVKLGILGRALKAVVNAVKAVAEFASRIVQLLGRFVGLLGDIVTHPIRFFENLGAGIGQGISSFISDIDKYLTAAFFDWIRGTTSGLPIEIPDKLNASGIFSLVSQLLGLTWDTFWERVQFKFGPQITATLRKGERIAHKGLEIFSLVKEKGIGGLWEHISSSIGSFLSDTLNSLKEMVLYQIIQKALRKLAKIFIPAGGFVAIVELVIAALKFLFENRNRILDLIETFMNTLEDAIHGRVQAIVEKVIKGLTNFITLAIDWLAKLFGFGDLNDKAQRFLERMRNPVIRGIDFALNKISPLVYRVFRQKQAPDQTAPPGQQLADTEVGENLEFIAGGKTHHLWINTQGPGVEVMVSSTPMTVLKKLEAWEEKLATLNPEEQAVAKPLLATAHRQYQETRKEGNEAETEIEQALAASDSREIAEAERADQEVETSEQNLLKTLKRLFEVYGETSHSFPDITQALSFSMGTQAHELQLISKNNTVQITMASDLRISLPLYLQKALDQLAEMPTFAGKTKIRKRLENALRASGADSIIEDWNMNKTGGTRARNQPDFVQERLTRIAEELSDLVIGDRKLPAIVGLFDLLNKNTRMPGPYTTLFADPIGSVAPFKEFSSTQRIEIIAANRRRPGHGGQIVSDCTPGEVLHDADPNDALKANVDHIYPRAKGGSNSYSNAQVISRAANLKKSDTTEGCP